MDELHKHNVELKKPDTKVSIMYDSIYMRCQVGELMHGVEVRIVEALVSDG